MQLTRENGIMIGVVADLDDPERLGRVRVTFPYLEDQQSYWARLVVPIAGKDRGVFYRPEVGDEVVVVFEQGDPRRPYIMGGVWNQQDPPPADDGNPTQNNWRFIKSRSGHIFKFDDTQGAEKIEIIDKNETHKVIIDSANQKIQVICDVGDVEVTASAGDVKVQALNIEVKGDVSVKVEAPTIDITAQAQATIDGGGMLTLKGGIVNIN